MSVQRISQSHANETQAVQNVNSQKSQNTATKSDAIEGRGAKSQAQSPAQPKATADSNVGRQQRQEQNTGNDTNGTRVNVFA